MKLKLTLLAVVLLSAGIASGTIPSQAGEFAIKHPRRAEVLHRNAHLNRRLDKNHGNLGGHYGELKSQANSIHQQERALSQAHGGHITKGERRMLNHEENQLNRQIHQDKMK